MKIYVSYPSARSGYAQKLTETLAAQRHEVVSDRIAQANPKSLREAVRDAIAAADLFIFVLAPEALAAGSHTRFELRQAQRLWPEPAGRVLTVPAAPTPWNDIPRYLRQCARVRAPGARSGSPEVGACAAAVAELERKGPLLRRALTADREAIETRPSAGHAVRAFTPSNLGPASRPAPALDSPAEPARRAPSTTQTQTHIQTQSAATAPAQSPSAALPPLAAPAPVAPPVPGPGVVAVAHPAHAASWAGQRSWRRGQSRGSGRRRSRKRRNGSWLAALRSLGSVNLAVALAGVLLLAGAAWMWFRLAPGAPQAPAAPLSPLAQLALSDPVARNAQRALLQCQGGNFASGLQQLAVMAAERAAPAFVQQAREDCAMNWLRGAEVRQGETNFTQLVAPLRLLLSQAVAAAPAAQRAADLRAHLGWADYLTWLDTRSPSMDPHASFKLALAQDPGNAYAQAMATVWTLAQGLAGGANSLTSMLVGTPGGGGASADPASPVRVSQQAATPDQIQRARQVLAQLQAATDNARSRADDSQALAFVRRVQLGSLGPVPEMMAENIRMLDEMRRGNEAREPQMMQLAWTHLYATAYQDQPQSRLQAALSAEDNLRTYLWCMPKAELATQNETDQAVWRLVHGMLLTQAGRGREARADLAALHAEVRLHLGVGEISRAVDRLLAQRQ